MKNFFKNLIVKWADHIKNNDISRKEQEKIKEEDWKVQHEHKRNVSNLVRKILGVWYNTQINDYHIKADSHIKAGDTAIVNRFNLGYSGHNSWDGGTATLFRYIKTEQINEPIMAYITEIIVDSSYTKELIDKFITTKIWESDQSNTLSTEEQIIDSFTQWVKTTNNEVGSIGNEYGLYLAARFTTNTGSDPNWTLNIFCFIPESSEYFHTTKTVWEEEIAIRNMYNDLKEKERILLDKKRNIENHIYAGKVAELAIS